MSVSELRLRVTAESAVIVVVLAVVAATLGGVRGIRPLADRQRAARRWTRGGDGRTPRPRLGPSGRARVRSHRPAVRSRGPGAAARPRSARGLMEAIEHPPIFSLPGIPDHVTYTW